MQANNTEEYEAQVRAYIARMLSSRKGRRKLAKKDQAIKHWKENQHVYGPVIKPIDLGINKFKKMAREKTKNPYGLIKNYKTEMWIAYESVTTKPLTEK